MANLSSSERTFIQDFIQQLQPYRHHHSTSIRKSLREKLGIMQYDPYRMSNYNCIELGDDNVLPTCNTLIATYERESGEVRCMAVGPKGVLYVGSCGDNIRAFQKGKPSEDFYGFKGPYYALLYGYGEHIFAASYDGRVRVWVREAAEQDLHSHIATLPKIRDRIKESYWRKKMRIKRKSDRLYWHNFPTTCISLSEDNKYLYSGSTDHAFKIWRVKGWKFIEAKLDHKLGVSAVAAGCKCLVFSGSKDGSVKMWKRDEDPKRKKPTHTSILNLLTDASAVNALLLKYTDEDGSGQLYAGLADGKVKFWTEKHFWLWVEDLCYHCKEVLCLAKSPGPLVFSGSLDGMICGWMMNPKSRSKHTLMMVLRAHESPVNCIAAAEDWEENDDGPCRCILYSGGQDKRIKTWRIADGVVDANQCGR